MTLKKCEAKTKRGLRCKKSAIDDQKFCSLHSKKSTDKPDSSEKVKQEEWFVAVLTLEPRDPDVKLYVRYVVDKKTLDECKKIKNKTIESDCCGQSKCTLCSFGKTKVEYVSSFKLKKEEENVAVKLTAKPIIGIDYLLDMIHRD